MGNQKSAGREPDDSGSASLCEGKVFAKNSGICVEPSDPGIKLHLGSGKIKWEDWINVDLYGDVADIKCDIRYLNFPDNYAKVAVAIHVIEHFYEWEVDEILREWRRVLEPGGKLVLELPCMDKILNYIQERLNNQEGLTASLTWYAIWGDPRHHSIPMCHKWGYTTQMIRGKLEDAGFYSIEFETPNYHFEMRDMRVVAYK